MTIATPISLSDEELQHAANESGIEFFDGELWEKPMSAEERRVTARITGFLFTEALKANAGQIFTEVGYRCNPEQPRSFRKPDLSFVRSERVPPNLGEIDVFEFPPDLAVEVLSPNDKVYDVDEKVREYLEAGFKVIWVVNPVERSVVIRRAGWSIEALYAADEITGDDWLPTFRCRVGAFFE